MQYHGGYSATARRHRKRAAVLSQRMRRGDGNAALSLRKRRYGLLSIAKHGWRVRVALMNQARKAKCKLRREERAAGAQATAVLVEQLQERGERKTQARIAEMERAARQAARELEARLQRQRPVRS
jgi:hypothetical protein